ncbi:MAG: helix-turn-helix transcriptional regulator [Actinobacteria bacterium]|nr:MAG: helix-turn-helix transcriptional regulator [Actinomycetota bacterium]
MPGARTRRRRPVPVTLALRQLGDKLRAARLEAGLSQAALGAPYYTRAHVSAIELGKIRPAMRSLEHMAGRLGKSASYFLDDPGAARAQGERRLELAAIAGLLTLSGAAEALRRAHKVLDDEGLSVRDRAQLHLYAGSALNLLQRGNDALPELAAAQRLAAGLGDAALGRGVDYQLAVATRSAGNARAAREMLEGLLGRIEQLRPPDQLLRLRVLITLGACAQDLGEPGAATTYYARALEWSKDIGDLTRLVAIYQGLGNAHRALGDHDAAAGYYQRALGAAELASDLVAVHVMHNALAVLAADAGRLEAAYAHVARAIEIAKVSGPSAFLAHYLATRAEVALKAKDWTLARTSADEALAAARERGAEADRANASASLVLAELDVRDGDVASGERRLRQVAATYRALGARAELGDVLMRLSRAAKKRRDLDAAERYATEAYKATRPISANVEV